MALPKIDPTTTKAWKKLQEHFNAVGDVKMQQLFAEHPSREEEMQINWKDFKVDFSKNRITDTTLALLFQLAEEVNLNEAIKAQFEGAFINETEQRAVLHTALRDKTSTKPEVKKTLEQMKEFSEKMSSGNWKGYTGKPITDIVNIGIGGSDLGPHMAVEALQYYKNHLHIHFISNIDGDHVMETLKKLKRETTVFLVVSKTFTTQETLTNATTVRNWFLEEASEEDIARHFAAVSTNVEAVKDFGIASENIFPLWDWVGGRFSLWSAVGLSICCAVGYPRFQEMLEGAHEMDLHFKESAFEQNIPVLLALVSIWYANFYKAETEAVIPYTQYLSKLVPYLQQATMESNGKSVDRNGNFVTYPTGTIVWGSTGTNAQHAFFQLIHQGTRLIPVDFIGFSEALHGNKEHHNKLLANLYGQTEALLYGTEEATVANNFKFFEGNKPSTTILIKKLTPKTVGSLLAMYEHKIFVQGIIWNIYSYDQWGVELGKKIAKNKLATLENKEPQ